MLSFIYVWHNFSYSGCTEETAGRCGRLDQEGDEYSQTGDQSTNYVSCTRLIQTTFNMASFDVPNCFSVANALQRGNTANVLRSELKVTLVWYSYTKSRWHCNIYMQSSDAAGRLYAKMSSPPSYVCRSLCSTNLYRRNEV